MDINLVYTNLVLDKKLVWIIFYIMFFGFIFSYFFRFLEGKNISTENSKIMLYLKKRSLREFWISLNDLLSTMVYDISCSLIMVIAIHNQLQIRVNGMKPQFCFFFSEKIKCFNHVTKRMGANLRGLICRGKGM